MALLIGNSNYTHLQSLTSPSKDIPALAQKLRDLHFKVTALYDLDEKSMKKAIKDFKKRLLKNPNSLALFYYSGHGSQANGESYLIPTDGDTRDEADVEADGVKVETIAKKMATAKTKANILFLDACRDVPVSTMGGTKGLGQVKHRPSGSLIVYSTSKDMTAKDDRVFNQTVLEKLAFNVPLTTLANDISYSVDKKTDGKQVPEVFAKSLPTLCLSGQCKEQEVKIVYRDRPQQVISQPKVEPTRVIDSGSKWMKDTGEYVNWKKAKEICRAKGGRLPTKEELGKVVTDCRGTITTYGDKNWDSLTDKNKANKSYQSCYKKRGFNSSNYWSSASSSDNDENAWIVYFYYGNQSLNSKSNSCYVRCVRAGQ
jgi:hypothetical protein